ncbi:MAG TPA: hypothetical protein VFS08_10450 [Gemmatimonadaceae bacterium]|nr:hypothetical protein [Gemmatimonadaceae bacterium]
MSIPTRLAALERAAADPRALRRQLRLAAAIADHCPGCEAIVVVFHPFTAVPGSLVVPDDQAGVGLCTLCGATFVTALGMRYLAEVEDREPESERGQALAAMPPEVARERFGELLPLFGVPALTDSVWRAAYDADRATVGVPAPTTCPLPEAA